MIVLIFQCLLGNCFVFEVNNVLPNIVVTPSDSAGVHWILYFPPTKERFKFLSHIFERGENENIFFILFVIKDERWWTPDLKAVWEELHFWLGSSIMDPEWKLWSSRRQIVETFWSQGSLKLNFSKTSSTRVWWLQTYSSVLVNVIRMRRKRHGWAESWLQEHLGSERQMQQIQGDGGGEGGWEVDT